MKIGHMCVNWKVIVGLVVVGLGILAVAPSLALSALPLLLVAICPLSMLVMMRGMHGGTNASPTIPTQQSSHEPLSRGEQLETLQVQLIRLQAESESLAQQIAQLEAVGAMEIGDAEVEPREIQRTLSLSESTRG